MAEQDNAPAPLPSGSADSIERETIQTRVNLLWNLVLPFIGAVEGLQKTLKGYS
jgi:hypothetical protein